MNRKHLYFQGVKVLMFVFVFVFQGNVFAETSEQTIKPDKGEPASLTQIQPLTPSVSYIAPQWSPDGTQLSFTKELFDALFIIDVDQKNMQTLVNEPFVGYAPKWSEDGDLLYVRSAGQGSTAILTQAVTRQGKKVKSKHRSKFDDALRLSVENDQIYIERKSPQADAFDLPTLVTDRKDQYFSPVLSPDGKYLLYEGIVSGLYVMHLKTGEKTHIGRGNHPLWSFDSRFIVFDQTEDDGTQLTAGELFLYDLHKNATTQLTDTHDVIEQHPALSPDNSKVAFDADGAIFVGTMNIWR